MVDSLVDGGGGCVLREEMRRDPEAQKTQGSDLREDSGHRTTARLVGCLALSGCLGEVEHQLRRDLSKSTE